MVIFGGMNAQVAQAAWFFLFQGVRDLPEALIQGREEMWLRFILTGWTYDPEALSEEDLAVYTRAYAQPGGLRGAFEDYRAWRDDLAQDRADADRSYGARHFRCGAPSSRLPRCWTWRRSGAAWPRIFGHTPWPGLAIFPMRSGPTKSPRCCWSSWPRADENPSRAVVGQHVSGIAMMTPAAVFRPAIQRALVS